MKKINPRTFTLTNGMRVVVVEKDTHPLVSLCLIVEAGSVYDPKGLKGMSHFVEHMNFAGTKKRGPGNIFS